MYLDQLQKAMEDYQPPLLGNKKLLSTLRRRLYEKRKLEPELNRHTNKDIILFTDTGFMQIMAQTYNKKGEWKLMTLDVVLDPESEGNYNDIKNTLIAKKK